MFVFVILGIKAEKNQLVRNSEKLSHVFCYAPQLPLSVTSQTLLATSYFVSRHLRLRIVNCSNLKKKNKPYREN
jgi:hypothetical protein